MYQLERKLSTMSRLLSLNDVPSISSIEEDENDVTLRLALLAMTQAEKRIERQEKRIKKLESLTITDELTGLLNRRGFLKELRQVLNLANRNETGGTLVIADLNKFKSVNDTFGHAAGDMVLRTVANCLRQKIRDTDSLGRLGGDEFAILMPGVEPDIAANRIIGLNNALNTINLNWNARKITVSATFGRFDYAPGDKDTAVLARADTQMYKGKRDIIKHL